MAVRDVSPKPFLQDDNDSISIGIDLPFTKGIDGSGWFATTKTTIGAVKNNIRNFMNTKNKCNI